MGWPSALRQSQFMNHNPFWTPEEVEFLDQFLFRDDAPEHCMDVTMLDGYLTAVVSGPELIMPSEMLRWVWDTEDGQEGAHFKDQAEAEKVMGLIMKQWNAIAQTLTESPELYEPQIYERELDDGTHVPIIDEWCMGYHHGISIGGKAWDTLMLEQPELLSTVLLYGSPDGWAALELLNQDDSEHQAAADGLGDTVRQVHAYWLAQRRQQKVSGQVQSPIRGANTPLQPVRRDGPKLGRNEPCHCGSGRKYKHCHGAN